MIERTAQLSEPVPLSPRERQVLLLTAEGLSSKGISWRLGISPRTAEVHRAHVMRKLKLRNRVDLVRYALMRGIVSLGVHQQAVGNAPA